jgi:hypothetical protein
MDTLVRSSESAKEKSKSFHFTDLQTKKQNKSYTSRETFLQNLNAFNIIPEDTFSPFSI